MAQDILDKHDYYQPAICKTPTETSVCLNGLLYGVEYNFKNQPERLKYIGRHNGWHQFEKVGKQGVWCELLDSDLHMIERTSAV